VIGAEGSQRETRNKAKFLIAAGFKVIVPRTSAQQQAANLLGQRGLTEVEKAGGPPEMKLSGENQERTHLCDIHSI
jgi:hypothetical protein